MSALNFNFTQADIEKANKGGDLAPIPAGIYTAQVNRSEVKPTRDGTGTYLSLGFQILEGDYTGRLIFQNIALTNKNATAVSIGRDQMAQLSGAVGVLNLTDSNQLHGVPVQIRVIIREDKTGQYEPQNEIKKFAAIAGAAPAATPAAGYTPPPSAPKQPVWARG